MQDLASVMVHVVTTRRQGGEAVSGVDLQRYSHLVLEFLSDSMTASAGRSPASKFKRRLN